jgi:hypothetical protein
MSAPEPLILGQIVYYIDDERFLSMAYACAIEDPTDPNTVINCTVANYRGMWARKIKIQRASHSGERWMVLNRWISSLDEVPEEEYHYPRPSLLLSQGYPQPPKY